MFKITKLFFAFCAIFIDKYYKSLYNNFILSRKEILREGGSTMTNADLMWHLIENLIQKEKELTQALEKIQNNNKSNVQKQDEA